MIVSIVLFDYSYEENLADRSHTCLAAILKPLLMGETAGCSLKSILWCKIAQNVPWVNAEYRWKGDMKEKFRCSPLALALSDATTDKTPIDNSHH